MVVAKKQAINLNYPPEIFDLFHALVKGRNGKAKWTVGAAALIALRRLPIAKREELIQRVYGDEGMGKSLQPLIDEAIRASGEKPGRHGPRQAAKDEGPPKD